MGNCTTMPTVTMNGSLWGCSYGHMETQEEEAHVTTSQNILSRTMTSLQQTQPSSCQSTRHEQVLQLKESSKCHLVKIPWEAKAANEWCMCLSFCAQELSLESVNAFGALWSARIQSPQLPRKRGARVCASHLFEHGKHPDLQVTHLKSSSTKRLLHTFPISSCFMFFLFSVGTLMVKVTLQSSKKRPNDKRLIT